MTNQEIKDTGLLIKNEQQIGGNTALRVGGVIEGIGYALDNKDAANGYYQATINGGSISVNAPNFVLGTGGNLRLKMPAAGTTASTLTIGNANAVQLWYNGAAVSSDNTWEADEIISVFYDGTRFMASNSQGGMKMDDIPTAGSEKAAKSGGIYASTAGIKNGNNGSDLDIEDEARNILARFANGHFQTKYFDSSQLPELATKNNENFDFTIEDETGNAIALFQRGHIRTKNFNSETFSAANYLKDKFQGKKIAIIGDSISTYQGWLPSDVSGFSGTTYATYYPQGDVNSVDKTWWHQVALNLGIPASDIANTSWSGSKACGDSTSTTNGHAGCSTKRINDIAIHGYVPDIIIVYIGCNDWYQCGLQGYNITLGTWAITDAVPAEGTINAFRSAYALMLAKIQNAYPSSRIFCCTILDDWRRDGIGDDDSDNAWPSNDGAGYTTKQWNDNIKEIADAFACDVIDLHNCGITYFNIQQYYAVDAGLHPNAAGHALMARKITSELMAKY